jgi:hypothetical protein
VLISVISKHPSAFFNFSTYFNPINFFQGGICRIARGHRAPET